MRRFDSLAPGDLCRPQPAWEWGRFSAPLALEKVLQSLRQSSVIKTVTSAKFRSNNISLNMRSSKYRSSRESVTRFVIVELVCHSGQSTAGKEQLRSIKRRKEDRLRRSTLHLSHSIPDIARAAESNWSWGLIHWSHWRSDSVLRLACKFVYSPKSAVMNSQRSYLEALVLKLKSMRSVRGTMISMAAAAAQTRSYWKWTRLPAFHQYYPWT